MVHRRSIAGAAASLLCGLLASSGTAQELSNLHHVTKGVSQSHVEYHQMVVPKGRETVLADLKGPGKVTYFYVTPVSDALVLKISGTMNPNPAFWCR